MELIKAMKVFTQKQKVVASDLDVTDVTLNLVLNGKANPGPKLKARMEKWVEAQKAIVGTSETETR